MQDKQDKGIGRYRDRPGYFMGGMIGGAILGALVNKIQGKDWKRGALWGGISGGIGSAALGGKGWFGGDLGPTPAWITGMPEGITRSMLMGAAKNPHVAGATLGLGASYLAGDPEYDKRKIREEKERRLREQMARNRQFYPNWYTNPWTGDEMNPYGRNTGGMINARKRYYNGGGSATLEYTDPDLYTPTGEGGGPSSNPILQIPLGPEGSFADEFEDLDLAGGPSGSDMSGWHEMYEDLKGKGELPDWMDSFEIFMQNLDVLDISPWDFTQADPQTQGRFPLVGGEMAAEGGYKTRPKYAGGGIEDLDMTGGGASFGPGTGTSDDIPAMLSDGEFVVTANAVQNLGGGDRMLGARRMYQMMNQLDPNSQTPAEMNTVGYA